VDFSLWVTLLPHASRYAIAALVIAGVLAGVSFAIMVVVDRHGRPG
jgi:hypothetical protein